MLKLDFGAPVVAVADVVEPAPVRPLERISSSTILDTDQRLIDMWLHGKSLHTQRAYKRAAEHFLEFVGKPLGAVTLLDFQAFTDALAGKASSRRQVVASIKALLSLGWRLGLLPVNVGPALANFKAPNTLSDRILSEADVARMLACSEGRDHLLVRLLYAGGLRVSELLGVKWRNIAAAPDGTAYVTVCGKGGKARTVRVTQTTAVLLLAHRTARPWTIMSSRVAMARSTLLRRGESCEVSRKAPALKRACPRISCGIHMRRMPSIGVPRSQRCVIHWDILLLQSRIAMRMLGRPNRQDYRWRSST